MRSGIDPLPQIPLTHCFARLGSLALPFAGFAVRKQLHAEEARGGRWAVEMADESVLEALSRRRKIAAKAVYFLARKGREILGQRCVLLKHFEPGHADNSGCHGQAERIAQQGIHVCLAGTAAEKEFLTSNFHGDNAEI